METIKFHFLLFVIAVSASIISAIRQSSHSSEDDVPKNNSIDSPPGEPMLNAMNPPPWFSEEMKDRLRAIANDCGKVYITQKDVHDHIISDISRDCSELIGWDIWDISIHQSPGQFERMERGCMDQSIKVLCYDPEHRIAKVQGTSAIYLVSCHRCSCPDFRKRHLPCKHIYALLISLDGDDEQWIVDEEHKRLYGLTFALAGRFPGGRDSDSGIRALIEKDGGQWIDYVNAYRCSALVTGANPSENKLEEAKTIDMEILTEFDLENLFLPDA